MGEDSPVDRQPGIALRRKTDKRRCGAVTSTYRRRPVPLGFAARPAAQALRLPSSSKPGRIAEPGRSTPELHGGRGGGTRGSRGRASPVYAAVGLGFSGLGWGFHSCAEKKNSNRHFFFLTTASASDRVTSKVVDQRPTDATNEPKPPDATSDCGDRSATELKNFFFFCC